MTTPVNKVAGVGPKTVEYLKRRRITTAEALVKRGTSALETAPGFSFGRAATVIEAANRLLSGEPRVKTAKPTTKVKAEKPAKKEKGKKEKKKDKKSKDKKRRKNKKKDKKKDKKNKKGKKNKK